jgi:hypothetical protein
MLQNLAQKKLFCTKFASSRPPGSAPKVIKLLPKVSRGKKIFQNPEVLPKILNFLIDLGADAHLGHDIVSPSGYITIGS